MSCQNLSCKYLFRRILGEFTGKPVYTAITVIVLSLLTAVTMLFTTLASYSSERVIANALEDGQMAAVYQYTDEDPVGWGACGESVHARIIRDDDINGITIYCDQDTQGYFGIIESADELLALGYEFKGEYLPLENDNDVYYPDYLLDINYANAKIGDEITTVAKTLILKGIIKTGYEKYFTIEYDPSEGWGTPSFKDGLTEREQKIAHYYEINFYCIYFCKSCVSFSSDYACADYIVNAYERLYRTNAEGDMKTFILNPYSLKISTENYTYLVDDGSYLHFANWAKNYVMAEDGFHEKGGSQTERDENGNRITVYNESIPVNDDEIVISQKLYNLLFNEDYRVAEDAEIPEHLGETISFSIMDGDKELITISDKKLIGVSTSKLTDEAVQSIRIVTTEIEEIRKLTLSVFGKIFKVEGNIEENLTKWRQDGIMFMGYFAEAAYQRERDFRQITSFSGIASAALAVLSVVAVVCFVSLRINESKKEIGIMRSMGVSQKELYIIFLGGTLLAALLAFIIANICIAVAVPVINAICADEIFTELKFLTFTFLSELSGIGVGLLLPMICAVVPTAKIISRPPVKLLRG